MQTLVQRVMWNINRSDKSFPHGNGELESPHTDFGLNLWVSLSPCFPHPYHCHHLIIRNGMSGNPALIKVFWHINFNYFITEEEVPGNGFAGFVKTT